MKTITFIISILFCINSFSQASWRGQFYFNLINLKGDTIQPKDLKNKKVMFFSFSSERESIKYDSKNKCFVFNANTITESKSFYVITGKDTLKINCPILSRKAVFVKKHIPIKNSFISFTSSTLIDLMVNNESIFKIDNDDVFYLNEPISNTELDSKEQNHIKMHNKRFNAIKFEEI